MISSDYFEKYLVDKFKRRKLNLYLSNTTKEENIHQFLDIIKNLQIPGVEGKRGYRSKKEDENFEMAFEYPKSFSKYVIEEKDKNE